MEQTNGTFMYHTNCTKCGSSDGVAVYDNETSHCFVCGKNERKVNTSRPVDTYTRQAKIMSLPSDIEYKALNKRKISQAICRKYGYGWVTDNNGNKCQAATYYSDSGTALAMKLRYPDKSFKFIGQPKEVSLFGKQLWGSSGKYITITEGEIDCLSVAQAFDGKYPVVSIPNGAPATKKALSKELEWLNGFEKVYLWFDNDEAGRKAIEECIPLFPAGKVKVISHNEYKDANEVLVNKGISEVVNTFYNAKDYRPDGIVTVEELEELVTKPVEYGLPWCFDGLTKLTYGRRFGEIHLIGAGTATGKTDLILNQVAFDIQNGIKCGTFMLEQNVLETLKRIAGKIDGKHYHLPNDNNIYDVEQLKLTVRKIRETDNLYMYNNFGSIDWEVIQDKIRVMCHNYGVKCFYIDNMTALTSHASDERRFIDGFMESVATLAQELGIWICIVSHLNPPKKGASHEMGGKVEPSQFTGSRAIQRWAHYMFGFERNSQHEDEGERSKGIFRCIKDRYAGSATGRKLSLRYDSSTGLLREVDEEFSSVADEDFEEKGDY